MAVFPLCALLSGTKEVSGSPHLEVLSSALRTSCKGWSGRVLRKDKIGLCSVVWRHGGSVADGVRPHPCGFPVQGLSIRGCGLITGRGATPTSTRCCTAPLGVAWQHKKNLPSTAPVPGVCDTTYCMLQGDY